MLCHIYAGIKGASTKCIKMRRRAYDIDHKDYVQISHSFFWYKRFQFVSLLKLCKYLLDDYVLYNRARFIREKKSEQQNENIFYPSHNFSELSSRVLESFFFVQQQVFLFHLKRKLRNFNKRRLHSKDFYFFESRIFMPTLTWTKKRREIFLYHIQRKSNQMLLKRNARDSKK